jgi:hypothetical protein
MKFGESLAELLTLSLRNTEVLLYALIALAVGAHALKKGFLHKEELLLAGELFVVHATVKALRTKAINEKACGALEGAPQAHSEAESGP